MPDESADHFARSIRGTDSSGLRRGVGGGGGWREGARGLSNSLRDGSERQVVPRGEPSSRQTSPAAVASWRDIARSVSIIRSCYSSSVEPFARYFAARRRSRDASCPPVKSEARNEAWGRVDGAAFAREEAFEYPVLKARAFRPPSAPFDSIVVGENACPSAAARPLSARTPYILATTLSLVFASRARTCNS